MKVSPGRKTDVGGETQVNFAVECSKGPESSLWFSIAREHESWISPRLDGALLALLIPAMRQNEDLHLDGVVTETLLFRANGDLQSLLKTMAPDLSLISVSARESSPAEKRVNRVTTAFSGGVDSFSVIGDYFLAETVPRSLRVTDLVFFNVGSHGPGGEKLFRARFDRLMPGARRLGAPFIAVNSNLDSWYDARDSFPKTHVIRTAATATVFQQGIGRHLHATAYQWPNFRVQPDPYYTSLSEPILLSLVSTDSLSVVASGASRSRVAKVEFVSGIAESWNSLDVCTSPLAAGNCSGCEKCESAMLTMDLLGVLDRYHTVFDIKGFELKKAQIIARVWNGSRPHDRELQALSQSLDLEPTAFSRITQGLRERGLHLRRRISNRVRSE